MTALTTNIRQLIALLHRQDWVLSTLARLVFAAVLARYFLGSALTKLAGPFTPTDGAYVQIYPRAMEAVGYDSGQLGGIATLVVLAGAWAEIVLPALIVVGLLTRPAALGMIGFVVVQSLTDIYGHLAGPETIGRWFDGASDALILDQRALWLMLLAVLVVKGAGPLSLDRLFGSRLAPARDFVAS